MVKPKKRMQHIIFQVQTKLQADNKQMARFLRIRLADFEAIASGAKVLPLPSQKSLERRLNALLDACGLEGLK